MGLLLRGAQLTARPQEEDVGADTPGPSVSPCSAAQFSFLCMDSVHFSGFLLKTDA